MELIPVNSQKLKIILTKEDMDSLDITNAELDYSSAKTRRALGSILEKAKNETGFDTGKDRLHIEVFLCADGGCEMFFTKRARLLWEQGEKHGSSDSYCNGYIASSSCTEDIINLCKRLYAEGFDGLSSLYSLDGQYLLCISGAKKRHQEDFSRFSFMCDYCNIRCEDAVTLEYIKEHGKNIVKDNAVQLLDGYFGDK